MHFQSHTARAALVLSLFPLAFAHIGLWDPSAFGFNLDGYTPVKPLSNLPFDEWWFHGNLGSKPPGPPMALPAGGTVTVQLACRKAFTSYGSDGDGNSPCPIDIPSQHAGSPVDPKQVLGCGLAIAYNSDATKVLPGDFTIFSVNTDCVTLLNQDFQVPADMPACPDGKCTCAWFWQGQDSDNEMYMTGFECSVTGATSTARVAKGVPPRYCGGEPSNCVAGPKQPMYWANESPNIVFSGEYEKKPSYNEKWGFTNGAQNDIFDGAGGPAPSGTGSSPAPARPSTGSSPVPARPSTRSRRVPAPSINGPRRVPAPSSTGSRPVPMRSSSGPSPVPTTFSSVVVPAPTKAPEDDCEE